MSAPDPADFGALPGDGAFLASLHDHAALASTPAEHRFDMAKRLGMLDDHGGGTGRAIVNLPADGQLGSRWRHLLTPDQIREAHERGQFSWLLAGHDVDQQGDAGGAATR